MSDKLVSECTDKELFNAFVERLHRLDASINSINRLLQSGHCESCVEGGVGTSCDMAVRFDMSGQLTHFVTY